MLSLYQYGVFGLELMLGSSGRMQGLVELAGKDLSCRELREVLGQMNFSKGLHSRCEVSVSSLHAE